MLLETQEMLAFHTQCSTPSPGICQLQFRQCLKTCAVARGGSYRRLLPGGLVCSLPLSTFVALVNRKNQPMSGSRNKTECIMIVDVESDVVEVGCVGFTHHRSSTDMMFWVHSQSVKCSWHETFVQHIMESDDNSRIGSKNIERTQNLSKWQNW